MSTLTTFRIRGFTGPNADFDFEHVGNPGPLEGTNLKIALFAHLSASHMTWRAAIAEVDPYYLGEDEERSDLRDVDSQRVYLFDDIESFDPEDEFNDDHVQRFMVTVDIVE